MCGEDLPALLPPRPGAGFRQEAERTQNSSEPARALVLGPGEPSDPCPAPLPQSPRDPCSSRPAAAAGSSAPPSGREPGPRERCAPPPRPSPRRPAPALTHQLLPNPAPHAPAVADAVVARRTRGAEAAGGGGRRV